MNLRKIRVFIFMVVFGMLFVSFKILQPEIEAAEETVRKDPAVGGNKQVTPLVLDEPEQHVNLGHIKFEVDLNEPVDSNSSTEYRKQWLLQHYQVQWDKLLDSSPWKLAASWVNHRKLVPSSAPEIGAVLQEMTSAQIVSAGVGFSGTQLKMSLVLQGNQKVVFKPKWFARDHVIQGIYEGGDRHNGEIASFHLSRIMDLGKTPLAVGRTVDLISEIKPVATKTLLDTYFTRGNNTCFYGKCLYCKTEADGVCADGTKLEGVVVLWLPPNYKLSKLQRHPFMRTYRKGKQAPWEKNDAYCDTVVKKSAPYNKGPRLLDITDASVFDYLVGNADRHHYETFKDFPEETMMVMLDNGKTFGNPHHDEPSILAPIYQCCKLRRKTWNRLHLLRDGVLSDVLREILAGDPIAPVLYEPHYAAMDRRLLKAIDAVKKCIAERGEDQVLVEDGYS